MSPTTPRPSTDRSRRQFLAGGGAALAASLTTLTAGCLSSLPPLGSDQRYGRLGVPSADAPNYREWLPAPSSADLPAERYRVAALRPTGPRPDAPELFVARRAHAKAALDAFGIGFENYDRLVDCTLGTVVEATFDRLTAAAGGNPYVGISSAVRDPTDRPATLADAIRFDDEYAYQVVHYRYLTDRVPTRDQLETALREHDHRFADGADAFDVRIDREPLWTDADAVAAGSEATIDLDDHPEATGVCLVYSTGGTHFHVLFGLDLRGETDG